MSILSLGPRVAKEDHKLVARTSLLFAALTLGVCLKRCEVDPRERLVTHRRRLFWVFSKTWRIPFETIREVLYRYENLSPFSSISAQQAVDCFTILLETHERDEIKLFSWVGAGTFENNSVYPDWMHWDEYLIDFTGTQDAESRVFFSTLRDMIFPRTLDPRSGPSLPQYAPPPRAKPAVRPYQPPPR